MIIIMDTVHIKEIVLYAYTHNTFKYIHTHTYYGGQMFHSVLFNRRDGHSGNIVLKYSIRC